MPYIEHKDRKKFEDSIEDLSEKIENDGDLNYCISSLLHKLLKKRGKNYQNMNNLVGSLECAKLEFSRTVMGPYEDIKRDLNGSVSELDFVNFNK